MMGPKIIKAYKKACNDIDFQVDIKDVYGGDFPTYFFDDKEKSLFAAVYFGWYVGKFGPKIWEILINE